MSVETTLGQLTVEGGILKQHREPVLVLVNPVRDGTHLSCDWIFTHPGLVPGAYPLVGGLKVNIPPELCAPEGRADANANVTLEVTDEQQA